jgi:hypothetical protein
MGVGVCAGDHYDNHTDNGKPTPIYPSTYTGKPTPIYPPTTHPTPTTAIFLNKISSVFTCCLIIRIISYSSNYSRFVPSIFYFFETFLSIIHFFRDFCFRNAIFSGYQFFDIIVFDIFSFELWSPYQISNIDFRNSAFNTFSQITFQLK